MPQLVVAGAALQCTMGTAPGSFTPTPHKTMGGGPLAGNIMDHKPTVNIAPFGMCISILNPQVAAATAAALGTLTPQPCVPATAAPWAPGAATLLLDYQPALDNVSKCACTWGGVISVTSPGQGTITIP